jgi:Flp pilus assembly protein TadG
MENRKEKNMWPSGTYDVHGRLNRRAGHTSRSGKGRPARRQSAGTRERGQSLIEFTLIMPLLLLVATGMVAFGLALHNGLMLTAAVNNGGQLLAFSRGQTTDPCATAYSAISGAAPSLASGLSLSFVINGTTYSSKSCTAGASNMVQGASAQVTATYPCPLAIFQESFPSCSLTSQVTELIQ